MSGKISVRMLGLVSPSLAWPNVQSARNDEGVFKAIQKAFERLFKRVFKVFKRGVLTLVKRPFFRLVKGHCLRPF